MSIMDTGLSHAQPQAKIAKDTGEVSQHLVITVQAITELEAAFSNLRDRLSAILVHSESPLPSVPTDRMTSPDVDVTCAISDMINTSNMRLSQLLKDINFTIRRVRL